MKFLFDTNFCIALINGSPHTARRHFERAMATGHEMFVSSIAIFELWYGVFGSDRVRFNANRLEAFLEAPVAHLIFDGEDARAAGVIKAALKRKGRPIGSYDVLLAGQALARNLTLITANVTEFSRVEGLKLQDWTSD